MNGFLTSDENLVKIVIQFFKGANRLTYAAIGVGLIVAILYFRIFFRKRDGFNDLPEDYSSRFTVDYQWSKMKLELLVLISVICGVIAYYRLPVWFPNWFHK